LGLSRAALTVILFLVSAQVAMEDGQAQKPGSTKS
jgi:hypothetical protein